MDSANHPDLSAQPAFPPSLASKLQLSDLSYNLGRQAKATLVSQWWQELP